MGRRKKKRKPRQSPPRPAPKEPITVTIAQGQPTHIAGISHPKQIAFLSAYVACHGNKTKAAALLGISRQDHYAWIREDPRYATAFEDAYQQVCDRVEDEIDRRAIEGVLKPVFGSLGHSDGTGKVGEIIEYSDTLLIVRAKALMPEKYKDRVANEHSGPDGGPIAVKAVRDMTDGELLAIAATGLPATETTATATAPTAEAPPP